MTEKPAMSLAQSVAQCLESHADLPEHARFVSSVNRAILESRRAQALESVGMKAPPLDHKAPGADPHYVAKADRGKPRMSLIPWEVWDYRGSSPAFVNALRCAQEGTPDAAAFRSIYFETAPDTLLTLEYGAVKYGAHSWRTVPNAQERYLDAMCRHEDAVLRGERIDAESGLTHTGLRGANALFLWCLYQAQERDP